MMKKETEQTLIKNTPENLTIETIAPPQKTEQYLLKGFIFVILVALETGLVQFLSTLAHGLNAFDLFQHPGLQWTYEFLGGNRNPSSIGMEIFVWAQTGVGCKMVFLSAQAIKNRKFEFLRYMIIWASSSLYAWGIGVTLIFSLSIISLTIAGVEITLANASLETIIAISFVIGFYYEEAVKLLGRLREQISRGLQKESKKQDVDE